MKTCVFTCEVLFLSDLKSFSSEFILGLVQAMDSEKDPRNLLVVFGLVKTVGYNFTIGWY
jgi:DNA repair/transcription protein MET18/MMS19